MATVSDLIHSSFRLIGAIAAGEVLETTELNDALISLNQMISSWSTEQVTIYHIRVDSFALTGASSYTMGPGGVFTGPRPPRIVAARASTAGYGRGLKMVDVDRWTQILERGGGTVNLPMKAYVDASWPLTTLYLWPVPTTGVNLEIYTLQEFTSFPEAVTTAAGAQAPPVHNFFPQRMTYTTAGANSVTIGPGGTLQLNRPCRIESVAATFGTSYRNVVEIVSPLEWSALLEPGGQPITLPMEMYVEYGFPTVTINLWPTGGTGSIEIHSMEALSQFVNLTDTVSFPEGYEQAIRYNFAVALLPEYPRAAVDPTLLQQAQNFKASLVQLNTQNQQRMPVVAAAETAAANTART